MRPRLAFSIGLGLMATIGLVGSANADLVQPGDLIVVDRGNGTLDVVNPTTGATNFVIASGFSNPQGVAINAQGRIFVSDIGTSTIDAVNPTTGVVTTFSGSGVGSGPALNRPFEMAFSSGTLYVAEGGVPNGNTTAVYAIDAAGNRTVVAGNNGSSNNLFGQVPGGPRHRLEGDHLRVRAHRGYDLSGRPGDGYTPDDGRLGPAGPRLWRQWPDPRGQRQPVESVDLVDRPGKRECHDPVG